MEFKRGDLVTRISYNHDTVFKITNIKNNICYLKGLEVRLFADANSNDLIKYIPKEKIEVEIPEKTTTETRNSKDYFYLPARILHLDTDNQLSNKPTNPYKIRENSKFNNHKKSQKKQKISNFS